MNIKGLIELKNKGLPTLQNLLIFRNVSDIPSGFLDTFGNEKRWAIRGFDDRFTINDSPYNCGSFTHLTFSRDEFKEVFVKMNEVMKDVPEKNRIFLICKVFYDEDVEFSGHALKDKDFIHIDILNGNRPSGKDWTPDISFSLPLKSGKTDTPSIKDKKYKKYIEKIYLDIVQFSGTVYLDFTLLKDKYFLYHDLSLH